MKILGINSVPYGSTCRIMLGVKSVAKKHGIHVDTASGYSYHPVKDLPDQHIPVGGMVGKLLHTRLARFTGYHGCFSHFATWRLLRKIQKEQYDIVHLHNIHGWYLNFPMLTRYIKKNNIKVIWTLHDCWSFTGQCPHYAMIGCEKWKTHCFDCPQCKDYPRVDIDRSERMYDLKKKWFTGMNAVLVTPSQWLAGQVKQSFLKDYPVKVIHNGIDLDIFQPTESDFKQKYHCEGKKLVLGVSMDWGVKKGLDVFVELANRLPKAYQVVLVGGNEKTDRQLPANVISIHRTQNQKELAEIYTAADVFVNPTREETLGLVNVEALACGTPVVTFDAGGSPECVNESCGIVVPKDDIDAMERAIYYICKDRPFSQEACFAHAAHFDKDDRFAEYVELYELLNSNSCARAFTKS